MTLDLSLLRPIGFFPEVMGQPPHPGLSLSDLRRPAGGPEETAVLGYLAAGHAVAAAPSLAPVDPFTGQAITGAFMLFSDGQRWRWPFYLPYLVAAYHVALDPEFVADALAHRRSAEGDSATP